jgi:WD40 repeat protein/serine/threonine protein kinase
MAPEHSEHFVLLTRLADEFVARYRRGERPSLQEYLDKHPELANDLCELVPAMVEIERVKKDHHVTEQPAVPRPAESPPLQQLGDYRLLREIGRGGMGVVYEAEQLSLGRHVALKLLLQKMLCHSRHKQRFEREARAAAKLHHTNIVPVFGVGEHEGTPYYVMQFIQGLGLDAVLDELRRLRSTGQGSGSALSPGRIGTPPPRDLSAEEMARSLLTGQFQPAPGTTVDELPHPSADPAAVAAPGSPPVATTALSDSSGLSSVILPGQSDNGRQPRAKKLTYWQSVANIGVQVADALEYAHRQGVQHRDIKPSNLLLDTQGTVWVTDFGLAKADDQQNLTQTGDLLGTLRYMPPEAFEGKSDARGDVYALGLTLYELLALEPAFAEKDRPRLIKQVTTTGPLRLGKRNAEVPRDLETIVHKAIDQEPARRYQTAGELAADLGRFLRDEPIQARPIGRTERLWRWCRRNPAVALASGLAVAALLVALVVSLSLALEERRHARELAGALHKSDGYRHKAESRLAESYLDRGVSLCDQGEVARGLLWLMRALQVAPAEARDLQRVIRINLAAWHRELNPLEAVLPDQYFEVHPVSSRDGTVLLTVDTQGRAHLWEAATGKRIAGPFPNEGPARASLNPNGRTVLTVHGTHGTAQLWDATTGKPIGLPLTHSGMVRAEAFSPDGNRLVTAGADRTARLWDPHTGTPVGKPLPHPADVVAVAFSPRGDVLLTRSCRTAFLWDAATGKPLGQPLERLQALHAAVFSPDGRTLLTGCADRAARLWQVPSGHPLGAPLVLQEPVRAVAFSPDGKTFLTSANEPFGVTSEVRLWDALTRKPIGERLDHQDVRAWTFSPDGKTLATGGGDRMVRLWETATAKPLGQLLGHKHRLRTVAFSPDGRLVGSGSTDHTSRLWDVRTGKLLGAPLEHNETVRFVSFDPNGRVFLTHARDNNVRLFALGPGSLLDHKAIVPPYPLKAMAFSPDGKTLLTGGGCGSAEGGEARVWEVATGTLRGKPVTHRLEVRWVTFSPDGGVLSAAVESRSGRRTGAQP